MKKIKTEIYSRVSGYFRPTSQWNAGKREEFSERKTVNMEKINEVSDKKIQGLKQHNTIY